MIVAIYKGTDGDFFADKEKRGELSSVKCSCGEERLLVNWIDARYTGGFLKVTCKNCESSLILLDDYS
jgi:hypothetical protein